MLHHEGQGEQAGGPEEEDNLNPPLDPRLEAAIEPALEALNSQLEANNTPRLTHVGASTLNQHELSALLDNAIHANLLANTHDPIHKARLLCLGREGASDWLGAAPSHALGLHLNTEEFVYVAR